MIRWKIAVLTSAAIAISYLDRQTLPWAIAAIREDIPISNQLKAALDTAFLVTYGLMYLGGGRLMDRLGTRRGFIIIMLFWSIACASHGFATGVVMLAVSRLLLGVGEGGGFPAATRAVAEWFPVRERSTAMGIINGGTAVGAVVAPPLIAFVLTRIGWLDLAPWRWVFFLTGAHGRDLDDVVVARVLPSRGPSGALSATERALVAPPPATGEKAQPSEALIPLKTLLAHKETWGVVIAKFLSDAAWYFYLFWLPTFLFDTFGFDIKTASSVGWIPYAASGVGCLVGGGLSSWLLGRGYSVDASQKNRARSQRRVDALGALRADALVGAGGDRDFQPGVLRAAVVVDARDDSADRHDSAPIGRHRGRSRRPGRSHGRRRPGSTGGMASRPRVQLRAGAVGRWIVARARISRDLPDDPPHPAASLRACRGAVS